MNTLEQLKDKALDLFATQRIGEALAMIQRNPELAAWTADNLKKPSREDVRAQRLFAILNHTNQAPSEALADSLELRGGEHVLELGFGGGAALVRAGQALQAGGGGFLGGVDISADCVAVAQAALDQCAFSDVEVELKAGSATEIPFPDASFDAIIHLNCWYFWPDLEEGLRECARVLRPGGIMITGSKIEGVKAFFGARLSEVRERAFHHIDLADYEDAARMAGFSDVMSSVNVAGTGQLDGFTITRATRS